MNCKVCGTPLGEYDENCPYCGTAVDSQTDNFADFENTGAKPESGAKHSFSDKFAGKYDSSAPKLPKELILAGAIGVALLLSLISLIVAGGAVKKANDRVSYLQEQVNMMQSSVDAAYAKAATLENEVAMLTAAATAPSSSSSSQASADEIIRAPSDEVAALGREDVWLFSVEVKSSDDKFTWQKYNSATGTWDNVEVSNGDNGFNAIWEKKDDGTGIRGKLIANLITENSFGKYRCVITTASGATLTTGEATLTEAAG